MLLLLLLLFVFSKTDHEFFEFEMTVGFPGGTSWEAGTWLTAEKGECDLGNMGAYLVLEAMGVGASQNKDRGRRVVP